MMVVSRVIVFLLLVSVDCQNLLSEVIYEWVSLEYDWPNDGGAMRSKYEAQGLYVPHNNVLAGIKIYKNTTYVTVPRWKHGVPSTLNKIVHTGHDSRLQPFPSWKMQELGNCDSLQYVQSMEIDPECGWMWIIDVGRVNIFESPDESGLGPINLCPPKLVIYDIDKDEIVRVHVFDNSVASHTTNFLNDIVIDRIHRFAYITDARSNNSQGGIIAYSYDKDKARVFWGPSTAINPRAENININNHSYIFSTPSDGIALSQDGTILFYCPLSSYAVYSVTTSLLRNFDISLLDIRSQIRLIGIRASQSDGLAFSRQQKLYFGVQSQTAVYYWDSTVDGNDSNPEMERKLVANSTTMVWIDTFAFDENGYLWFTTNQLNKFLAGEMTFTDSSDPNFRIIRVFVNESSYMDRTVANFAHSPIVSQSPRTVSPTKLQTTTSNPTELPPVSSSATKFPTSSSTTPLSTSYTQPTQTMVSELPQILYQWQYLDYTWPSYSAKILGKARGHFIQPNNIPMHVKQFENRTFVTVPRLKPGVPSTLNMLDTKGDLLLNPYPSWTMQELGKCTALQSVEGIEIDPSCNQMWIVDSGRVGYLHHNNDSTSEIRMMSICPPKVILFNLTDDSIIRLHEFQNTDVSHEQSELGNIVVDKVKQFAFIANQGWNNNGSLGGIVIYDFKKDRSRQVSTPIPQNMTAEDQVYNVRFPKGVHSLALRLNTSQLFFSRLSSSTFYSVNLDDLANFTMPESTIQFQTVIAKMKSSLTSMIVGKSGKLYIGTQVSKSIYVMDEMDDSTVADQMLSLRNDTEMEWPESLAFSSHGNLLMVVNKFNRFISGNLACNTEPNRKINFFVWEIDIKHDTSYIDIGHDNSLACPRNQVKDNRELAQRVVDIFTLAMGVVLAVAIVVFLFLFFFGHIRLSARKSDKLKTHKTTEMSEPLIDE